MPGIGNLLLGADAGALQDEVGDVYAPAFGTETNESGLSITESNVEPRAALS
jgi:hypothetical protein